MESTVVQCFFSTHSQYVFIYFYLRILKCSLRESFEAKSIASYFQAKEIVLYAVMLNCKLKAIICTNSESKTTSFHEELTAYHGVPN